MCVLQARGSLPSSTQSRRLECHTPSRGPAAVVRLTGVAATGQYGARVARAISSGLAARTTSPTGTPSARRSWTPGKGREDPTPTALS